MSTFLLFLIVGLSAGAVFAALAQGIVVTYQGTGVINFAAAALATVPLYVYDELRHGRLTLPLPWVPTINWGPPPTFVAVLVALVVAAVLGAVVQFAVSRPLRTAPVLAKVVAAIAVMLVLQAGVGLKYGTDARPRDTILPTGTVRVLGANLAVDRLWFIAVVVVLSAALAAWMAWSRTGLAVRAAAENERAAGFARLSPQALGMVTWVLSGVFVALIMILGGPITGVITPTSLTLLVVPALAAALIARLRSLPAALIGGLVLGAFQSELFFLSSTKSWWPGWAKQGLSDAIPFIAIVITLFAVGKSMPMRGDDTRTSLPPVILPRNRPLMVAALTVGGLFALLLTSGSYRFGVVTSLALALIALSLVLLTGMVGQISLAQAAFAGVSVLVLAKLGTSVPFPISALIAVVAATISGVIVGLPALRIRGAQLAVVTLAAALTLEKFVFGNPNVLSPTVDSIPPPSLLGIDLSVREGSNVSRIEFGLLVLAVVVVVFVITGNVMRGSSGRKMLAVRSNERAAASIGIGVAGVKLTAFALASTLAGIGGVLIGYSRGQLTPASYGVFVGLGLLATAYLAGISSVSGAVVAGAAGTLGVVFVVLDRSLKLGKYYPLISGLGLLLTVVMNPVGIAGKVRADVDRLLARRRPVGPTPSEHVTEPAIRATKPSVDVRRTIGNVVLRTRGITVDYGGVRAVDDVSIEVRAGEIVGLIGPNGAGKTSFIDAITGFTRSSGEVTLDGDSLGELAAHQRARRGLVRTWQAGEMFEDLSTLNNVRVAAEVGESARRLARDCIRPNPPTPPEVTNALLLMGLDDVAARRPSELPLGRQKALGVARALALQPQVLLLDEPAAGLDPAESVAFGEHLRQIAAGGVGCLLIDHDMHLVLDVCDRVYVIEFGRQIFVGTPTEMRSAPAVLDAYLGSDAGSERARLDPDSQLDHPEPELEQPTMIALQSVAGATS